MTAIALRRNLSTELTDLIARLGNRMVLDDGLTPDELRDLREWLQAARALHHEELREARGKRCMAEVVKLREGYLPERFADATPSDSPGAA